MKNEDSQDRTVSEKIEDVNYYKQFYVRIFELTKFNKNVLSNFFLII